ncbi:hypothetical protein [Nocardia niigatensis]
MTDLRDFHRVCYAAAEQSSGRVVEFRVATDVTLNFHQGIVTHSERRAGVVCPRDSKVLAVAEPRTIEFLDNARTSGPLPFIEAPALVCVLRRWPEFHVLDAAELNGPFDPTAWPGINPTDIEYWQPETLGEALFNYWD